MTARNTPISGGELADELSTWAVGLGILTMALAPLAIPMVALTAAAALVVLAPVLAMGLLAGLIAVPILLLRAAGRHWGQAWRRRGASESRRPRPSPGEHRSHPNPTRA